MRGERGVMRVIVGIMLLGIALCYGGVAQAAPQYNLACIDCHQMPPLDSAGGTRDPNTGAVKGNHQAHAGTTQASCVKCHGNQVTNYNTSHRTKQIQMNSILNGSPLGAAAAYSRVFFNQTSVPPATLGTCSSVNCHFEATTPAWGTAAFSTQADCSKCHAVAPNTGNHPRFGSKHGNYFGTDTTSCVKCHPDHTAGGYNRAAFAHATSAAHTAIKVQFTAFPNSGGIYTGTATNFLPSQTPSFGYCDNIYCHSDGRGNPPYQRAKWGNSLDCTSCHNSSVASFSPMSSGKHKKHINNATFLGTNYGCVDCHSKTVSNDSTIIDYTKHVNGFVDFSGAKAGHTYTSGTGVCSTVYCHSDGKGGYKTFTNLNGWKSTATLDCTGCHGSDSSPDFTPSYGAPNYASVGGAGAPRANTHKVHVGGAGDCVNCHSQTTTNGTSITSNGKHTNGTADVYNGGGKTFTYSNDATKTCSNISCHSGGGIINNPNPAQWGASLGCIGCHGDATNPTLSAAHAKHVSPTTGKGYTCDTCHNQTVSGSTTIIGPTYHGNGVADVNGTQIPNASYGGAATPTCATSCHNRLVSGNTPNWNTLSSGQCGTCHKATTTYGLISTAGHRAHFTRAYGPNGGGLTLFDGSSTTSCSLCHNYTTDIASSHDNSTGTTQMLTGIGWPGGVGGTCTNCHKQNITQTTWNNDTRVTCESCHTTTGGALSVINTVTAPDKTSNATTGHGQAGINKVCLDCHNSNSAHIPVTPGTYTRLTANLTGTLNTECKYCHDNATRVTTPAYRNMSTHVLVKGGGQASACNTCHDPHGSTNIFMLRTSINGQNNITVTDDVNGLVNTTTNQGFCQVCHTQTNYFKAGVPETNHPTTGCMSCHKHNAGSGAFVPNRACDSCHGYPPAPRVVTTSVTFGVQNNWSSARFEDYSGGGGAHVVGAHIPANAKPSDGWANCAICHNGGRTATTPYHIKALPIGTHINNVHVEVDPQYRFSNTFITYTGAKLVNPPARNVTGSCFNVSCHFVKSKPWSIER